MQSCHLKIRTILFLSNQYFFNLCFALFSWLELLVQCQIRGDRPYFVPNKGENVQSFSIKYVSCRCFFFFFFLFGRAMQILAPQPGIKPTPPAVEAQSLNHWTTREVPVSCSLLVNAVLSG